MDKVRQNLKGLLLLIALNVVVVGPVLYFFGHAGIRILLGTLVVGGLLVAIVLSTKRPLLTFAFGSLALSLALRIAGIYPEASGALRLLALVAAVGHAAVAVINAVVGDGSSARVSAWSGRVFAVAANFTFVGLTFTMFRAASLDKAGAMYERLLTFTTYTPNLDIRVLLTILGALVLQWTPRKVYEWARVRFIRSPALLQAAVLFAVALALREAATADAVPFVYFQF